MNEVSQQKTRESILKSLAIAGFISIVILIAWASVQLVNLVPSAFSSLASLAESMNQYEKSEVMKDSEQQDLTVTSNTKLVNTKEVVNLSWSTTEVPGSYTFNYKCVDGVAVDLVDVTGIGAINCDTNYNIGNTNTLSLLINSEKQRFQDITYSISFLGTNDLTPRATGEATLTVMNSEINDIKDETEVAITDVVTPEEVAETTEPETTTPTETVTKPTPVYEQEFVYTIPTSDPNGKTDLATKFVAFGTIVGNTFFTSSIKQEEKGAIQFEIKNYGTKTSTKWTYEINLPNGELYTSPEQAPLKPNERALITVGFPTTDKSTHNFKVTVTEKTDKNLTNNQFTRVATFLK